MASGQIEGRTEILIRLEPAMIEYPTTAAARLAMRRAGEERAKLFRAMLGGLVPGRRVLAFRAGRFLRYCPA